MKALATTLLASAFALTATLAIAQSDPHHPADNAAGAPAATEEIAPEAAPAPEPQKADNACPDAPSMMDMMTMMGSGEAAMPMMQMMGMAQMMQATQLEMMRTMAMMQEQMELMQQRLEDLAQSGEKSP